MHAEYLPEFQGVYLEDSYFLGFVAEHCDLRLKMLFALTIDHPEYARPSAGEQHCYREGGILFQRANVADLRPGKPVVRSDPDGSLDFGNVDLFRRNTDGFRVVKEWFEATLTAEQVSVELV